MQCRWVVSRAGRLGGVFWLLRLFGLTDDRSGALAVRRRYTLLSKPGTRWACTRRPRRRQDGSRQTAEDWSADYAAGLARPCAYREARLAAEVSRNTGVLLVTRWEKSPVGCVARPNSPRSPFVRARPSQVDLRLDVGIASHPPSIRGPYSITRRCAGHSPR
uniref:Uncharacterized protein n=1 Tax=Mycena chlorophos TaxID=658473 RepID=A0ABQ0LCS9_MYCCL|nr:predicted protein [Mycena chlorophos]